MYRQILSYGSVAGLIVGIPLFGIAVALNGHPPTTWGAVVGYLTMLVALSLVFVAIKRRRDGELGGVIRFWPAFGLGLAISLVAGVFYVVAWEAALAFTGMDFAGDYAKAVVEQQRAKGLGPEALAKLAADMETFRVQYANPLYRIPVTLSEILPVGVLVSLVSAALLRNPRFFPAPRA
jgi:hypothetical protein